MKVVVAAIGENPNKFVITPSDAAVRAKYLWKVLYGRLPNGKLKDNMAQSPMQNGELELKRAAAHFSKIGDKFGLRLVANIAAMMYVSKSWNFA